MNGLKYVRTQNKMSLQEVGDAIGVTKSIVSKWERDERTISRDNLSKLCSLFNIPSYYFSEDLTEAEMLDVQKLKLQNDMKRTMVAVENLDGGTVMMESTVIDQSLIGNLRVNGVMRKKVELINKISESIIPTETFENNDELEEYIITHENKLLSDINMMQLFHEIVSSRKSSSKVIGTILMTLYYLYEVDSDTKCIYDDTLLSQLYKVLQKYKNK